MKEKKKNSGLDYFAFDRKNTGLFFLGIGLTMFIVNITAMIQSLIILMDEGIAVQYPFSVFYVSLISSVLLMIYALYNIYAKD